MISNKKNIVSSFNPAESTERIKEIEVTDSFLTHKSDSNNFSNRYLENSSDRFKRSLTNSNNFIYNRISSKTSDMNNQQSPNLRNSTNYHKQNPTANTHQSYSKFSTNPRVFLEDRNPIDIKNQQILQKNQIQHKSFMPYPNLNASPNNFQEYNHRPSNHNIYNKAHYQPSSFNRQVSQGNENRRKSSHINYKGYGSSR